jgi:hypothetical protein
MAHHQLNHSTHSRRRRRKEREKEAKRIFEDILTVHSYTLKKPKLEQHQKDP